MIGFGVDVCHDEIGKSQAVKADGVEGPEAGKALVHRGLGVEDDGECAGEAEVHQDAQHVEKDRLVEGRVVEDKVKAPPKDVDHQARDEV